MQNSFEKSVLHTFWRCTFCFCFLELGIIVCLKVWLSRSLSSSSLWFCSAYLHRDNIFEVFLYNLISSLHISAVFVCMFVFVVFLCVFFFLSVFSENRCFTTIFIFVCLSWLLCGDRTAVTSFCFFRVNWNVSFCKPTPFLNLLGMQRRWKMTTPHVL